VLGRDFAAATTSICAEHSGVSGLGEHCQAA
jgi:hypothetical protein